MQHVLTHLIHFNAVGSRKGEEICGGNPARAEQSKPCTSPIMRAWMLRQGFGQVPFINIHDLDQLTAELARLLGVTLTETTLPDPNYA